MKRATVRLASAAATAIALTIASPAEAQERLCDPAFQNCRTQLLSLINNERVGIDVAFWFMEDSRYSTAIINRWRAGVPVRVLMDTRSTAPLNGQILNALAAAGIPMRRRVTSGIMHWKMMLFAGQRIVEFGSANYSPNAFVPISPYTNYLDETVYFTDDDAIVNTFMTRFDRSWTDTTNFRNYANVTVLAAKYPVFPTAAELNFTPGQSFASRSVALYDRETSGIDVQMYRLTDANHADAIIRARRRGVPVRLIFEPTEYRQTARPSNALNVDRMWAAGVSVRVRAHAGLMHQKSVVLRSQRTVIFGSSNWSRPSDNTQQEHNYFVRSKSWIYSWFVAQFSRKWGNTNPIRAAETKAFTPLPPDAPRLRLPANGATGVATTTTLQWHGGLWAQTYDIYYGTTNPPPLYAANVALGPSTSSSHHQNYTLPRLAARRTYYWRIVGKTAAPRSANSVVRSFTTGG